MDVTAAVTALTARAISIRLAGESIDSTPLMALASSAVSALGHVDMMRPGATRMKAVKTATGARITVHSRYAASYSQALSQNMEQGLGTTLEQVQQSIVTAVKS
jgi:hypothetical protein